MGDGPAHLRPGRNLVAALVTYYGHPNSFWQPAASTGVMGRDAQLVLEARVGAEWLITDERWHPLPVDPGAPLWTDSYSDLLHVFRGFG